MKKYYQALVQYLCALAKHWKLLSLGGLIGLSKLLEVILPHLVIPYWLWIAALLTMILIAQFLTWYDIKREKDNLEDRLESPQSAKKILGQRTYSLDDKNALSDMFRSLRELLNIKITPLERSTQNLNNRANRTISFDPKEIQNEVDRIKRSFDEAQAELADIRKKYTAYAPILDGLLNGLEYSLKDQQSELWNFWQCLDTADLILHDAPAKAGYVGALLETAYIPMREQTGKLNSSAHQTLLKISEIEAALIER